jgi:hypothetical protein
MYQHKVTSTPNLDVRQNIFVVEKLSVPDCASVDPIFPEFFGKHSKLIGYIPLAIEDANFFKWRAV